MCSSPRSHCRVRPMKPNGTSVKRIPEGQQITCLYPLVQIVALRQAVISKHLDRMQMVQKVNLRNASHQRSCLDSQHFSRKRSNSTKHPKNTIIFVKESQHDRPGTHSEFRTQQPNQTSNRCIKFSGLVLCSMETVYRCVQYHIVSFLRCKTMVQNGWTVCSKRHVRHQN